MTKLISKINTEERIVTQALELFNKQGIEYIGMRELAASLGMRIGNITYYFPTKHHLVSRLATDLAALNTATILVQKDMSVQSFLTMMEQVFYNHEKYRCLLLSFVHVLTQNDVISEKYRPTEGKRRHTWRTNLLLLHKNGYLLTKSKADIDFIESAISLIARFWISEAVVSYPYYTVKQQIRHYLHMLATILVPYLSAKGKKEVSAFFKAAK